MRNHLQVWRTWCFRARVQARASTHTIGTNTDKARRSVVYHGGPGAVVLPAALWVVAKPEFLQRYARLLYLLIGDAADWRDLDDNATLFSRAGRLPSPAGLLRDLAS